MVKYSKKKCKNCGKPFFPKSEKNIFCSRKCFKKDYYYRKKEEDDTGFPIYVCPKCGLRIKMEIHPIRDNLKWLEWHKLPCPGCYHPIIFRSMSPSPSDSFSISPSISISLSVSISPSASPSASQVEDYITI